ncbi:MAG TPA: chromosome partition protein MukB [Myxococcota bacterium]|nr:chromosome partition protein MukB [Myxococcota bacterium]
MSRVAAEALVLVNWRGVFYERYALDRHVTALEGDNGAGKTTVMIAAYVVLLPDMSRLRFTNLGETGATGGDKGIWGRLGEPGRPAYAAMEFRLPRGERVLAGVHLDRKGEPTVEPTPFLVTGLRDDVRLQDLLLLAQGELELVPELSELRDNAARLGGRLQVFASAKDYFAALFEHGITPMRLGTDEERNKLNEMLKTSMTGGMSKGLLQELRSFLLKEEVGLAETLNRMRANLDACRRTRIEVVEAQRLEREIGSVYEAGEEMFAAAVAATRQRADEMSKRVAEKEAAAALAAAAAQAAEAALRTTQEALQAAETDRGSSAEEVAASKAWVERVRHALHWASELDARERTLSDATSLREVAERARAEADQALHRATEQVALASDARERAATGLADLQKGLEELHRRADAHRRVTERLQAARRELDDPGFEASDADALAEQTEQHLADTDRERRELARRIDDANAHRGEHAEAVAALTTIVERTVDPAEAFHVAGDALAVVRAWRDAASQRATLADHLQRSEAEAARQRAAAEHARALGVAWTPGSGRITVTEALAAAERAHADAESQTRAAEEAGAEAERQLSDAKKQIRSLEARAIAWRDLDAKARRLTAALATPVSSREALDPARTALHDRLDTQRAEGVRLSTRRAELLAEARQLRHAGGSFPDALLALRDTLTADLLASHFDDVGLDQAAELEARLGPLAQALVVPDVEQAARAIVGRPDALPTVWLVAEDAALTLDPDTTVGAAATRDVLVREREALRVTRLPDRPTLGRTARQKRADALDRDAGQLDAALERNRAAERQTRGLLSEADALLEGAATWSLGDPAAELEAARRLAGETDRARRVAEQNATTSRHRAQALAPRVRALRVLLPDAALLDAPDLAETLAHLRDQLRASDDAIAHLARIGEAPRVLERDRDALRHVPWSDDEVSGARERLSALDARRDRLGAGLEALRYVAGNAAALGWTDAAAQLAQHQGLVPALQGQLHAAKRELEAAQAAETTAKSAATAAQSCYNQRDAEYATARERRDEAAKRVAESGVALPTEALLAEAEARATQARRALANAETRWGQLQKDVGRRQAEAEAANKDADTARAAVEDERKQARPAVEGWDRLRPQLESAGLMTAALSERFQKAFGGQGSVNVWQTARDNRARLVERLRSARGGPDILGEVKRWLEDTDQNVGEGYLRAWVIVRGWLSARLPAQIAEGDEPLEALQRFRDHLGGLVERLERQERDLRGASEDVARGIDVQIRKAQVRVRRLNEHLDGVRFGSIRGIRVKMQRVERMEQVLRALRSGEAQELLFQAGMPVEEALDEIFRRFGGGRTGGQRLLDYREYLHLQVEVLRGGGQDWEVANPTRLSTGEAIGVGAALMMVVLTEWERDANLLRGRRATGSMRFLFLDEANRLDQANLGTVFDLCRNLDLQLLVAAPEVARAEGCTVFRLVRTRGEDGTEQVLVSGRRVVGEA